MYRDPHGRTTLTFQGRAHVVALVCLLGGMFVIGPVDWTEETAVCVGFQVLLVFYLVETLLFVVLEAAASMHVGEAYRRVLAFAVVGTVVVVAVAAVAGIVAIAAVVAVCAVVSSRLPAALQIGAVGVVAFVRAVLCAIGIG